MCNFYLTHPRFESFLCKYLMFCFEFCFEICHSNEIEFLSRFVTIWLTTTCTENLLTTWLIAWRTCCAFAYIYLKLYCAFAGLPIIGPVPANLSHRELKKFIQGICEEVLNLPNTLDFSHVPGRPEEPLPYFDPKRYEQLLATAVLNKVNKRT